MHTAQHTIPQRADCPVFQSCSECDSLSEETAIPLPTPQSSDIPSPNFFRRYPEVGLMYAVLQDALHCFCGHSSRSPRNAQRLAREAEEWFFSDDVEWPFSFLNVCAVLGLDPSYIRRGVQRWRQCPPGEQQRKIRPTVPTRRPLRIAV